MLALGYVALVSKGEQDQPGEQRSDGDEESDGGLADGGVVGLDVVWTDDDKFGFRATNDKEDDSNSWQKLQQPQLLRHS